MGTRGCCPPLGAPEGHSALGSSLCVSTAGGGGHGAVLSHLHSAALSRPSAAQTSGPVLHFRHPPFLPVALRGSVKHIT